MVKLDVCGRCGLPVSHLFHTKSEDCVEALKVRVDDERERSRRMRHLLVSAAANLDRHMPDGAGARGVLTSQMRDAIADKWDEGEWEDNEEYRRLR